MADPLLFLAYAAAKWLQKGRRDEAAAAAELKERNKAAAEAKAANTIQYYGQDRTKPNSSPVLMTPMLQNSENYDIVYEKLGTADIKKVDPKSTQEPLFMTAKGQTGTKSYFEKQVIPTFGKFGDLSDFALKRVGSVVTTNGKSEEKFFPAPVIERIFPKEKDAKPKDNFIAQGTIIKDGEPVTVYAENIATLEAKYPDVQRPGQIQISDEQAKELGFGDTILPQKEKSFITPPPAQKLGQLFVGETKNGQIVYGENPRDVLDQGAVKVGEAENLGKDDDGDIKTGPITWRTKEVNKKAQSNFVDVIKVGPDGKGVGGVVAIPLSTYQQNPDGYIPQSDKAYTVSDPENPYTSSRNYNIPLSPTPAKENAKAMEIVDSPIDIKFKNRDGNNDRYYLTKDFKAQPLVSLQGFVDQKLPKKEDGSIDFQAAGMTPAKIDELGNYAARLIQKDATTVVDGVVVPNDVILNRRALEFEKAYPVLSKIPGLKKKIYDMVGMEAEETKAKIAEANALSPEGNPQGVIVAEIPTNVPSIKIPMAIPFAPKYTSMVELVLSELAPSGTAEDQREAEVVFSNLVNYERDRNGNTIMDENGGMRVAKYQPDFEFLNYTTQTKHAGTPLLSVYRNMIRPNKMRDLGNDQVEADIKRAFNEYVPDFDAGMTMIQSFLPQVGRNADRIYFEMQTDETGAAYERELQAQKAKADASQLALSYLGQMRQTFFRQDGSLIDMGTAMGQLYLAGDGLIYMSKQAIGTLVDKDIVQTALGTFDLQFKSVTESATSDEIERLAKDAGLSVDDYVRREDNARKEIYAMQNRPAADGGLLGLDSDDEMTKNFALRNYYRYMVAYSVAAAIQGGTGGRTISDQDVLNVLNAFKMEQLTSKAESEIAIIDAASDMLLNMGKHARALSEGGVRAFAARKLTELRIGSHGGNYTISSFEKRLEQPGKAKGSNPESDYTDRQLLIMLNRRLSAAEKVTELDKSSPAYKAMIADLKKQGQGT